MSKRGRGLSRFISAAYVRVPRQYAGGRSVHSRIRSYAAAVNVTIS